MPLIAGVVMDRLRRIARAFLIVCSAALAACGGSNAMNGPAYAGSPSCPPPSPGPTPEALSLLFPANGSTGISITIGSIDLAGPIIPGSVISVAPAGGSPLPLGSPAAAPSPIPTPNATPSPGWATAPVEAVPIPTLSHGTSYAVAWSYQEQDLTPPACTDTHTQQLGTFTTQ